MVARALHRTGKNAGKKKKPRAELARSRIVVDKVQRGSVTYQHELVKCGKAACRRCRRRAAHGPYWYAYWRSERSFGRVVSKYIGKNLPGWERTVMEDGE